MSPPLLWSRTEPSLHPFKLSQIKAVLGIYRTIFSLKQSDLHVVYLILIHDFFHFPRITHAVEASGFQQGSCCLLRFSSWVEWYAKRSEDLLEVTQRGKSLGSVSIIALHFYSSQAFALSSRRTFSSKDTKSVLNISSIPGFLAKRHFLP